MDMIIILAITFTLGMCFQYYIGKTLAKLFREHSSYSDLDGLGGKK